MKRLLLLFVLLSSTTLLVAQGSIRFGRPYEALHKKSMHVNYSKAFLVDASNQQLLALKTQRDLFAKDGITNIQTFDLSTLQEKQRQSGIKRPHIKTGFKVVDLQGRFYLLHSGPMGTIAERLSSPTLAQEIDPIAGELKGEPVTLTEDQVHYMKYTVFSPNQEQLLLYGAPIPTFKTQIPYTMAFKRFGKDLEVLDDLITCTFPYARHEVRSYDVTLKDDGFAYVLLALKRQFKENPHIESYFELFKVNLKDGSLVQTELKFGDKLPISIDLKAMPNNTIVLGGYYTFEESRTADPKGIFILHFDENGNVTKKAFHEIPIEILTSYETNAIQKTLIRQHEKGKAVMKDLKLHELLILPDGSILINGEVTNVKITTKTNFETPANRSSYTEEIITARYKAIVTAKLDVDGRLNWLHKIPKHHLIKQLLPYEKRAVEPKEDNLVSLPFYQSYCYFYDQGKHYYLYMDNIKNEVLDSDKHPDDHREGNSANLTVISIDHATGAYQKDIVVNTFNNDLDTKLERFKVNNIIPIGNQKVLVEFYLPKPNHEEVLMEIDLSKLTQ